MFPAFRGDSRRHHVAWQGSKGAGGSQTSQTSTTQTQTGSVSVEVGGVKLSLRSDKDPKVVQSIASYVDEKVGAIREAAPSVPIDKLLMLASLTVAEELFDARSRVDNLELELKERVATCLALLEDLETENR